MKSVKQVLLLMIASLLLIVTDADKSFAANYAPAGQVQEKGDNGIFKNKKKKKKDCDCPGNKKNRRKVARERRKNNTN